MDFIIKFISCTDRRDFYCYYYNFVSRTDRRGFYFYYYNNNNFVLCTDRRDYISKRKLKFHDKNLSFIYILKTSISMKNNLTFLK